MLKELAQVIIDYIIQERIPNSLKILIIFILRKEGEKDYLLLSIYRLIILENIIIKLVEKLITICITKIAKGN